MGKREGEAETLDGNNGVYYGAEGEALEDGGRSSLVVVTTPKSRTAADANVDPKDDEPTVATTYSKLTDKPPLSSLPNPLDTTSPLSVAFMSWLDPLLYQGY